MFHPSSTRVLLGAPAADALALFRARAAREKAAEAAAAPDPAPVVLTPHDYSPVERYEWARLTQGIAPEFCGHLCGATSALHGDLIRSRLLEKQPSVAELDTATDRAALMVTLMSMDAEADTLETDGTSQRYADSITPPTDSPSKDAP